jgi:hypothetical protein
MPNEQDIAENKALKQHGAYCDLWNYFFFNYKIRLSESELNKIISEVDKFQQTLNSKQNTIDIGGNNY